MPNMEFASMTTREEMDLEAIFAAHSVTEEFGEMLCIGTIINLETEPVKGDRPYGYLGCLSIPEPFEINRIRYDFRVILLHFLNYRCSFPSMWHASSSCFVST